MNSHRRPVTQCPFDFYACKGFELCASCAQTEIVARRAEAKKRAVASIKRRQTMREINVEAAE